MIHPAIQTACLLLGIWRCQRYPAFLLALLASLPFQWITPDMFYPRAVWEFCVWLPCAFLMVPAQAVAALEAVFRFGERYWLVWRVTAVLMLLGGIAAAAFWKLPFGDAVGQMVQAARYQRVCSCVFLVLSVTFYGTVRGKGLLTNPDGAHLILMALLSITWAIPILQPIPKAWNEWLAIDWPVTARTVILVCWSFAVALRQPRLQIVHPLP